MTVKLSDEQIYLRKVVKAADAFLTEYPKIFPSSGEKRELAEQVQVESLKSGLETLAWRCRLLLRYIETSDTVYMVTDAYGELRRASRDEVMKLLSKQDLREVIP